MKRVAAGLAVAGVIGAYYLAPRFARNSVIRREMRNLDNEHLNFMSKQRRDTR